VTVFTVDVIAPMIGASNHQSECLAYQLLVVAALLQVVAVAYGLILLGRRQGAAAGWLFLLAAMGSMLAWRIVVVIQAQPPSWFNPVIAIWGSTCMLAAMFFFGREVTLRRKAETERDALLASERAARESAERASRLKDDFLGTVSHELRTPLSVILSWCAILKTGKAGKSDQDKALDVIERNARLQARLVDDLLDMTRMQAGTLNLDLRPVALEPSVRSAMQSVMPTALAKDLRISFEASAAPLFVHGDPGRLQQIAANLLTNAIKFTPAGGHIDIQVQSGDGVARLLVRDDGEGIDPEFLPRLFGRFQQADSSTTRRQGGLGLGLSIVASLVKLHGGRVYAESEGLGRGATFNVELPLANLPATAHDVSTADTRQASTLDGLRLLLVDDEADVREATTLLLRQLGADVHALASAHGVLHEIRQFRPHVLVLDIGMPQQDGYSVLRNIRQQTDPAVRDIPAISLTAHAREEDRHRALEAGFQDHLHKPIDVPRLSATIRKLGGYRRQE
jgi:signal transduction histidine kinase/ActR/RegA family two-component response regulator